MENKLICPMSFCIQMGTIKYLFCEKEKCAWWDNSNEQCIEISKSDNLLFIVHSLEDNLKKMGDKNGKK